MPKPTNKYDIKHLQNLQRLQQRIDKIYRAATKEAAAIGVSVPNFNDDKPFVFEDYPETKKRIENLLKGLQKSIEVCVVSGIDAEWNLSNKKNDELTEKVFGKNARKLTNEQRARYFNNNDDARKAFIARKENGLGLSDRVWRYTKEFKSEIEMGLDLGLREGQSADEMSRDLRQYLQHPDKLFRRVRDEHGMLHLSKQAAAFHPGRGVYRSSYLNARRLAATEGNIAYRTADSERWREIDFVVGIEVHLSNNHTLKGRDGKPHPFTDICDELQGRYPKDFKFVGWHPNCRCYATSILKTDEEIAADTKKILNGEPVNGRSVNEVKDVPQGFKDWVLNNKERIGGAKSLPYFIKDNQRIVDNILNPTEELSALDIAKFRNEARTAKQVSAIKEAWAERKHKQAVIKKAASNILNVAKDYGEIDYSELQSVVDAGDITNMKAITRKVALAIVDMKKQEAKLLDLIPNAHSLHKKYTINELNGAYNEFEAVMNKWLNKYRYSSLDAAPLEHLRNKLDYELTSSTENYVHKDIINDAITAKISSINQKIEWNDLVSKVGNLRSFKTQSSIYKDVLNKIDEAISRSDFDLLKQSISEAEAQQNRLIEKQMKKGVDVKSALNKEYKGGVVGKDITARVNTDKMVSEDPYRGTFTNNVARMQGFDSPAKLVSDAEFDKLEKLTGEVFYRTVNSTHFRGKSMTSKEFASQLYTAELLELNGPGGRAYGDGMYVATSAWNGNRIVPLTDASKRGAYSSSIVYGSGGHTISEMTWTRKPKIIKQSELYDMWRKLTSKQRDAFGSNANTYACALGYDAMYCSGSDYMVVWNRSIIAVRKK